MNNGIIWLILGVGVLMLLGGNEKKPAPIPYDPALPGQSGGITEDMEI